MVMIRNVKLEWQDLIAKKRWSFMIFSGQDDRETVEKKAAAFLQIYNDKSALLCKMDLTLRFVLLRESFCGCRSAAWSYW